MSSWQTKPIGELVELNPDSISNGFDFNEIKYVDISSIGTGIRKDEPKNYKIKDAPSRAKRVVKSGDTILSTVRPNRRSFLYIENPEKNLVVSTGFAVLRPKLEKIDSRFLYYAIGHQRFTDFLTNNAKGAAYPAVDNKTVKRAEIPLPDLPTQQKIASILSAFDDLISTNTRRIEILEEMARGIYRKWFVHFRYPGHEEEELVDSGTDLGDIPEGWEVKKVDSVIETLGGGTPRRKKEEYWENGIHTWYTPSDLTSEEAMFMEDSSEKINELGLNNSSAKLFPAHSVMMTSRATIGVISINTTEACTNQGFIICVPSERLNKYQIFFWLHEKRKLIEKLASGATYKEINKGAFRDLDIVVPPDNLSEDFYDLVDPFGKQIQNLLKQNKKLKQTRDLLLPKLISGTIDLNKITDNKIL